MKLFLKIAVLVCLGSCALWLGIDASRVTAEERGDDQGVQSPQILVVQKSPTKTRAFMRKKLIAADQIMEGLTKPDPRLVRKGATAMIHMSKEAMWASHNSPSYAQDSADLVRAAERLIKLSKTNDLEGASHTYAQLTIQCVSCHRRVRGPRVALNVKPPSKVKFVTARLGTRVPTSLLNGN